MCSDMNIYTISSSSEFFSHFLTPWTNISQSTHLTVPSHFPLVYNFKCLRRGHIMRGDVSPDLGLKLSFSPRWLYRAESMAWWISSLTFAVSLVTDVSLSHPSSRRPIWEHLCWPRGLSELADDARTHGQNCCAGWGERVSMSSNCLGPHVLSTWGKHTRNDPG